MYLNPATDDFDNLIYDKTFIDHTEMLEVIANTLARPKDKYICVSRPRGFSKTTDAKMIVRFYRHGATLSQFNGLKISENQEICNKYLGKYNVIYLNMSNNLDPNVSIDTYLDNLKQHIFLDLQSSFPNVDISRFKDLSDAFGVIYETLRNKDNQDYSVVKENSFIFVVDEWDAPLELYENDEESQVYYMGWLNSLFKGKNYLSLTYMTGILPIKKYSNDSFMNMFTEYSMADPGVFAPYMGFTEADVMMLCDRYQEEIDDYKAWYDGYLMTTSKKAKNGVLCSDGIKRIFTKFHVYNPKSISMAFSMGDIKDYWDNTGSLYALRDFIDTDMLGVRTSIIEMIEGARITVDTSTFQNDITRFSCMDDILTMLVHLGYLTYDAETKEVYIPNREMMNAFSKILHANL